MSPAKIPVKLPSLTPDDFDIPHRRCFTPGELAPYLFTSADTIIRMIEEGSLHALRWGSGRKGFKIPYVEIVNYFKRQQATK